MSEPILPSTAPQEADGAATIHVERLREIAYAALHPFVRRAEYGWSHPNSVTPDAMTAIINALVAALPSTDHIVVERARVERLIAYVRASLDVEMAINEGGDATAERLTLTAAFRALRLPGDTADAP